jgi:hypothetical protein
VSNALDRIRAALEHLPAAGLDAAAAILPLVPVLVAEVEQLETQVRALTAERGKRKGIPCRCETCGRAFTVYPSELASGKKTGRFCRRACVRRGQEAKVLPSPSVKSGT